MLRRKQSGCRSEGVRRLHEGVETRSAWRAALAEAATPVVRFDGMGAELDGRYVATATGGLARCKVTHMLLCKPASFSRALSVGIEHCQFCIALSFGRIALSKLLVIAEFFFHLPSSGLHKHCAQSPLRINTQPRAALSVKSLFPFQPTIGAKSRSV